jgi:hypothetical protein
MNRKAYILLLIYGSWAVINIHRVWNNMAIEYVHPAPLDPSYEATKHWHYHVILKDVSVLMLMMAAYLYMSGNIRKDKDISRSFGAMVIVWISDIVHYLIWARHSEMVLSLQGMFLLITVTFILIRKLE